MKYLFLLNLFFISRLVLGQVNITDSGEDNYAYVPVTGNTTITTCGVFIYDSGGENGYYEKNNDGSITINPGTPGKFVKLEFINFDVEYKYDFVYVYNGIISEATLLGAFTGTALPSPIVASTSSGVLIVKFVSDYAVTKTGFKLYASCVDPTMVMPKNGGKEIALCNTKLYDSGGQDEDYSDNENGFITVLPDSPEKRVKLDFDEIDIEEGSDWLYVYDGSDTIAPLIGVFPGTSFPETLKASPDNLSGALTLKFSSNEASVSSGFSARISCFTPVSSITISGGTISLPVDSSLKLTAFVYPEDADDQSITWSTSAPSIVSIDAMGNIKGVGYGSAKVIAKSNDGYAVAEIDIGVYDITRTEQPRISEKFWINRKIWGES